MRSGFKVGVRCTDRVRLDAIVVDRNASTEARRSTAVALALLADHMDEGRDREAVNALVRSEPENRMHPNPLVTALSDGYMFRYRRVDATLAGLSLGTPNGTGRGAI